MQESPQIVPKVLVTTDFSAPSEWAFYHALSIAVRRQARLTLLHTGPEGRRDIAWERFPGVRQTLGRWGLLSPEAPRTAVAAELGVEVSKMAIRDDSPRFGITDYLRRHPTDLLVMATEGRAGLRRLINPSVADSVSYLTHSHTLMLPRDGAGLVDPETGRSGLRRVLCALDPARDPRVDLAYLRQWLPALADPAGFVVGCLDAPGGDLPVRQLAAESGWHVLPCAAQTTEAIIDTAREFAAELIVVHGRSPLSTWARVRGNRNDHLMRELKIPLLSMPTPRS